MAVAPGCCAFPGSWGRRRPSGLHYRAVRSCRQLQRLVVALPPALRGETARWPWCRIDRGHHWWLRRRLAVVLPPALREETAGRLEGRQPECLHHREFQDHHHHWRARRLAIVLPPTLGRETTGRPTPLLVAATPIQLLCSLHLVGGGGGRMTCCWGVQDHRLHRRLRHLAAVLPPPRGKRWRPGGLRC